MLPKPSRTIAVYYEHPEWFEPMFAEFDRRGVSYERLLAHGHVFNPAQLEPKYALVLNRMSPSAFTRGRAHTIPYTLQYLAYLKDIGANVINGFDAYQYEFSKARQLGLLAELGVKHPKSRVINHPLQAVKAAQALTFPIVIKPSIGGSGAGIQKFDSIGELQEAADAETFDLGLDNVGLVQEYLLPKDASVVRVEVLNGEFLYAIKLRLESPTSFNLCPADYCRPEDMKALGRKPEEAPVTGYMPPQAVIDTVKCIANAAHLEVGGIEYLVNEADGEIYYYDINALSNFVADAPNVVGFDPFLKLVDYVLERAGLAALATV